MAFEYTPWADAWNWLCEGEHGVVKLAMLVDNSCPTCNKFHEEVISKLEEVYDWFEVKFVEAKTVPFPPAAAPTGHFTYNFRHAKLGYPDIRAGAGPAHLVERDIVTMRAMNVYQKHYMELTEEEKEQNEKDKTNGHS
jgi:hypothetical protein